MRMNDKLRAAVVILAAFTWFSDLSRAADGVISIDQNAAMAGGVTPGDAPGFPITISQPGSYRLSSNLIVPNGLVNGIEIMVDDVVLDLNGFASMGPCLVKRSEGISILSECKSAPFVVGVVGIGIKAGDRVFGV